MTRTEAAALLVVALALIVTAVTLLFGAWGMGASGVVLLVVALFFIQIKEGPA